MQQVGFQGIDSHSDVLLDSLARSSLTIAVEHVQRPVFDPELMQPIRQRSGFGGDRHEFVFGRIVIRASLLFLASGRSDAGWVSRPVRTRHGCLLWTGRETRPTGQRGVRIQALPGRSRVRPSRGAGGGRLAYASGWDESRLTGGSRQVLQRSEH